jgi:hypothetical protein
MSRIFLFALAVSLWTPGLSLAQDSIADLLAWAKKSQSRLAYGLYIGGQKMGYSVDEVKVVQRDGKDVLRSTSEMYLATLFDGEKSIKEDRSVTYYELTGDGAILSAEVIRIEDGTRLERSIRREGKQLKIVTKQGGRNLERTIPLPRDTLRHQLDFEKWLLADRKKGDRFTKYSAAWEDADVNSKQIYTFRERKEILHGGLPTKVVVAEINLDGGKLEAVLFPDGRMLSGKLAQLSIKLEQEAEARKMTGKPADLLGLSAIVLDRDLGSARNVEELSLKLTGLEEVEVPASHRQQVTKKDDAVLVTLRRDFRVEKATPLTEEQKTAYLASTPRFQCDQEAIRAQATKIVGTEKEPLRAARKIEAWVYRNLRKSYSDNADTALEVLDRKAGDCTEHALLFVALARAAGIPAREVGGLAYIKGDKPMFGWHAWAEIHDGHQWVSIDPTWNQIYVDGTHLKMSEGEKDLAWANVVGQLKIQVLDVKKK